MKKLIAIAALAASIGAHAKYDPSPIEVAYMYCAGNAHQAHEVGNTYDERKEWLDDATWFIEAAYYHSGGAVSKAAFAKSVMQSIDYAKHIGLTKYDAMTTYSNQHIPELDTTCYHYRNARK